VRSVVATQYRVHSTPPRTRRQVSRRVENQRRSTIMTELDIRTTDHQAVRQTPLKSRTGSAGRRPGRCDQREPECRRAADPSGPVAGRFEPGELVAIAGGSGAGKTHIAGDPRRTATAVRRAGFGTTASFVVPGSAPIPVSATCPRTTSSISRCPCVAHCATRRGYGCPRARRRPRRSGCSGGDHAGPRPG